MNEESSHWPQPKVKMSSEFQISVPSPASGVSVGRQSNITVEQQLCTGSTTFEVIAYDELAGSDSAVIAQQLFFARNTGMKLRQVRILLAGDAITVEAGALHYMKGNIEVTNQTGGVGGALAKIVKSKLTGEGAFNPVYRGVGQVVLEPSFGHFFLVHLNNEEMVVDKKMFFASETSVKVGVFMQKNLSSALFGGEGLFQTKLSGTGVVVLSSPVPERELVKYTLSNDTLKVDGNFALLRKGQVEFTVERSAKTLLGSLTGGEGLLQTFRGTGEVWLAPTEPVYHAMRSGGVHAMAVPQQSSDNSTPVGGANVMNSLKGIFN